MADNLKDRGKADRQRISLEEPWERTYWSKALDATVPRLREAIAEVGHMAADVRKWLTEHRS